MGSPSPGCSTSAGPWLSKGFLWAVMGLLAPLWTQFRVKRSQAGWSGRAQSALTVPFQWPLLISSQGLWQVMNVLNWIFWESHECHSQREAENVYQSKEGTPKTERGHLRGMLLLAHTNSPSSSRKGKREKNASLAGSSTSCSYWHPSSQWKDFEGVLPAFNRRNCPIVTSLCINVAQHVGWCPAENRIHFIYHLLFEWDTMPSIRYMAKTARDSYLPWRGKICCTWHSPG